MKRSTTKRALISSVLALVMCFGMLTGTTFAWFTDTVTSGSNIIAAGNLDVELYNGLDDNASVVGSQTELFEEVELWEPGAVAYENLTVANKGSLALKYALSVNIAKKQGDKNLADVLQVGVVSDGIADNTAREDVLDAVEAWMPFASFVENGELYPADNAESKPSTKTYGIVIWWEPSDKDNDYNMNNGKTADQQLQLELGVVLTATQLSSEYDGFGNDYDADATLPGTNYIPVQGGAVDAPVALEGTFGADAPSVLKVNGAVSWETGAGHGSTPLSSPNLTISGNGPENSTFVATGSGVGPIRAGYVGDDGEFVPGVLTVKNITVVDKSVSYAEDSWEFTYLEFGDENTDELYFENVVFTSGITVVGQATFVNCTFITNADSEYAVWVSGGNATFTNCTFEGTRGLKMHEAYGSEIESVIVDQCEFNELSKKPGIAIGTLNADTTVSITNSVFTNCQAGDQGKYIYETDTDVTTFNFKEEFNSVVSTKTVNVNNVTELKDALSGAGQAGAGSTVINLPENAVLDLSTVAWTPIKVDGYHGADIITVNGNGATIKGLTAPLFAGGFAGGSGIIIKNLTIADSNIVSTSSQGSGAFIECVDSMELITLENCHLVNSTVSGSRTGGLIGWTSGYSNVNDGPVKLEVTIEKCSVVGCTINATGSAGAIIGHAGASDWTYTTIKNCTVTGNTITSTDSGDWRVGVIVGTANIGEVTITNVISSGNTVSQTGKTAPAGQSNLYGRFVPGTTGKLVIDGVEIK